MDSLPTEILYNILTHLPQRYAVTICSTVCKKWNHIINQPSFYSTIHIHSVQQFKKVIQLAKENETINGDKPIGYYVKHLIFHYEYIPEDDDAIELFVFPNLQSVYGLDSGRDTAIYYKPVFLQLNQPTHFPYCHHDEQWMIKFNTIKTNLKSLNIYMTEELIDYILKQEHEQFHPIHLKTIGIKKKHIIGTLSNSNTIPIKLLILSATTLINLTNLRIDFDYQSDIIFIINEYTFENIHQTCPLLESLSVEDFYMDIFDNDDDKNEYYIINDKKPYKPANRLKKIDIKYGRFGDPRCFTYFSNKYPKLESLSLNLWLEDIDENNLSFFEVSIFNMLLQFPLLKKLSFETRTTDGDISHWLHPPLIKWLYLYSNKLTYLKYPYKLIMTESLNYKLFNTNDMHILEGSSSHEQKQLQLQLQQIQIQPQPTFLNYLTSLSLYIEGVVQLASTYLSQNINTDIVSSVLKDLNIENIRDGPFREIYIYDWLDIFPNLVSLKLVNINKITDYKDSDGDDGDDDTNELHRLIKQRKQHQFNLNKIKNNHHNNGFYELKYLELVNSKIWFKNGFDKLFKKCQQLKKLKLVSITFVIYRKPLMNEIRLDLSHLHLELLHIDNLNYVIYYYGKITFFCIYILTIMEILNNSKRVIDDHNKKNISGLDNHGLRLTCKYVDELVCKLVH